MAPVSVPCTVAPIFAVVPYFLIRRRPRPRRHHNTSTCTLSLSLSSSLPYLTPCVHTYAVRSAVTSRRGYDTLGSPVNTSSPKQRSTSLLLPPPLLFRPASAFSFPLLSFSRNLLATLFLVPLVPPRPVRYPRFRHIRKSLARTADFIISASCQDGRT